jgi:DtxR family Mn-dependent transcriptional regulator
MDQAEKLSSSLEDYLEAILGIVESKQAARVKDISQALGVGSPSVTGALQTLSAKGLVNYAPYELITLTDEGRRIAADVARRHEILHKFLVTVLGVDEHEADLGACQMEHSISKTILERLVAYMARGTSDSEESVVN